MTLHKIIISAVLGLAASLASAQTYVGSFSTDGNTITFANGTTSSLPAAYWGTNPAVFSGLDAAALIFGGLASQYAVSTDRQAINNLAWYDGWGDHGGQQYASNYKLDSTGLGYNGCAIAGTNCMYSAYSAYIKDGFSSTNYVFLTAAVPEPETYALMLAGLGFVGAAVRRRKQALRA
jgi:hypothetical protein